MPTRFPASRHALLRLAVLVLALMAGTPAHGSAQPARWTHGAVCYEIFVRSFHDNDGDGVGDLNGLIAKLDYVNDGRADRHLDLGASCIWLMPIAASPSYHGYDVIDYYNVDPEYGTNADFKRLVAEAHRRGIRVIVDLVLNHASSEHPFFQQALRDPTSPYRDWFIFQPRPGPKNEWGGDNWHKSPIRDEYYYGFFWRGMPDLNWRSPAVREEMQRVATFWLRDLGADGFRLDAVRHLIEDGSRTANVPATHDALRQYAAHVRAVAPGAFTIGEVWDSTGALLSYYPDQLDAYFAFGISDAILDAVKTGGGTRMFREYRRLLDTLPPPPSRWAPFLRNHDQTRTMTFLGGDARRAKVAATLLLTLPGLPFVYYGEEIGMTGDKPDERIRTPMHWSRGPAAGFTAGKPWQPLQPDSLSANVEAQHGDSTSLLNLYRRLIHLRADNPAVADGWLYPLRSTRDSVIAYVRSTTERTVLVVANMGSFTLTESDFTAEDAEGAETRRAAIPLRSLPTLRSLRSAFQPRLDALSGRPAQLHVDQSGNGTTRLRFRGELPPVSAAVYELVPER